MNTRDRKNRRKWNQTQTQSLSLRIHRFKENSLFGILFIWFSFFCICRSFSLHTTTECTETLTFCKWDFFRTHLDLGQVNNNTLHCYTRICGKYDLTREEKKSSNKIAMKSYSRQTNSDFRFRWVSKNSIVRQNRVILRSNAVVVHKATTIYQQQHRASTLYYS